MAQHVIGTYNMSFMNDLMTPIGPGMAFASEGAFLARLRDDPDRRKFWNNAKNMLEAFITEKTPSVVGLQEMNLTEPGTGTGTDAINQILTGDYKQESGQVVAGPVVAGVSIIYNTAKIGEKVASACIDNTNQGGRPLMMLLTKKDGAHYLSVTMHGAQNPGLRKDNAAFNAYMVEKNKNFLESSIMAFLSENGIDAGSLAGVFITGDFNDRYDAIKDIKIGSKLASYIGPAPKSCCYNWDSSCPDEDVEIDFGEGYKTCKEPTEPTEIKNAAVGKKSLPGDRGAIKNYRYAGDKVFGFNPVEPMQIYRPNEKTISEESDHEFVYATVGENDGSVNATAAGGARRMRGKAKRATRKAVKKGMRGGKKNYRKSMKGRRRH